MNRYQKLAVIMNSVGHAVRRGDSIVNAITAMGTTRDPTEYSKFKFRAFDATDLATIYASGGIPRRICDLHAGEMTRTGWSLKADHESVEASQSAAKYHSARIGDLLAMQRFRLAETWARSQGGGIIVMGIDDGALNLSVPLRPGSWPIKWLRTYERCDVEILEVDTNARGGTYGQPKLYRTWRRADGTPGGTTVHASRVLHFGGMPVPTQYQQRNDGWDLSVIQYCYDAVRDLQAAYRGTGRLMGEFGLPVFKMDGQLEMIAGGNRNLVIEAMSLLNLGKSLANAIVIDKEDEFTQQSPSVQGVRDLITSHLEYVAMLVGAPLVKLAGQSPNGMSATGESDHRSWDNEVQSLKVDKHKGPMERLTKLILNEPNSPVKPNELIEWDVKPVPLLEMTEAQKAEIELKKAQTRQIYFMMGDLKTGRRGMNVDEVRANLRENGDDIIDDDDPSGGSGGGSGGGGLQAKLAALLEPPAVASAEHVAAVDPDDPEPAPATEGEEIQKQALKGAQIGSLLTIIQSVGAGTLTPETARPVLEVSFPTIPTEQLERMLAGAKAGRDPRGLLDHIVADAVERYDAGPFGQAGLLRMFNGREIEEALLQAYVDAGIELGEAEAERVASVFEVENPYFSDAVRTFRFRRLPGINKTTRDALELIFRDVAQQGLGRGAAVERMRDAYADFSRARAERIVRTEMTSLQSAANYAAWDASEMVGATEWVASFRNTRDTHMLLHGQRTPMGKPFRSASGATAMHPGGFGVPGEDINCQCVQIPVTPLSDAIDDDERWGRFDADVTTRKHERENAIADLYGKTYSALLKQFDNAVAPDKD